MSVIEEKGPHGEYQSHHYDLHYIRVVYGSARTNEDLDYLASLINALFSSRKSVINFFEEHRLWSATYFLNLLRASNPISRFAKLDGAREALEAHENFIGKETFCRSLRFVLAKDFGRKDSRGKVEITSEQVGALEYLIDRNYLDNEVISIVFRHPGSYLKYYSSNSFTENGPRRFAEKFSQAIDRFGMSTADFVRMALENRSIALARRYEWQPIFGEHTSAAITSALFPKGDDPTTGKGDEEIRRKNILSQLYDNVRKSCSWIFRP